MYPLRLNVFDLTKKRTPVLCKGISVNVLATKRNKTPATTKLSLNHLRNSCWRNQIMRTTVPRSIYERTCAPRIGQTNQEMS